MVLTYTLCVWIINVVFSTGTMYVVGCDYLIQKWVFIFVGNLTAAYFVNEFWCLRLAFIFHNV